MELVKYFFGLLLAAFSLAGFSREFGDLAFHGNSAVQTAYMSCGRIANDEPIQVNLIEIDLALCEYFSIGFWHWHYHDLTSNRNDKKDCLFSEFDWGVYVACEIPIADEWKFTARTLPRFFHMWFYNSEYRNAGMDMMSEWYARCALENPYVVPYFQMRYGYYQNYYLYYEPGLRKPIGLSHGFSITPSVHTSLGDNRQLVLNFGEPNDASRYRTAFISTTFSVTLDYDLTENIKLFTMLQEMFLVNPQARDKDLDGKRNELTLLTIGVDIRF